MLSSPISSATRPPLLEPSAPAATPGSARATPRPTRPPSAGVSLIPPVSRHRAAAPTPFPGLAACVDDARIAALVRDDGPPDPATFAALRSRLAAAGRDLPEAYRQAVLEPLLRDLDRLGPGGLARLLAEDPDREGAAALLLDAAQAVLQHGEGYRASATAAFQEVVSDLYADFLGDEQRAGVKPPDRGALPPLVRWGRADAGPYTWPVTDTAALGVAAPVVSLPAGNAAGGLLAWPALAHEAAGHDLMSADTGLGDQLARAVRQGLLEEKLGPTVAAYFADRIDETAADVLGVLNMGPAAAVGLIGYFRALNAAWGGTPRLRSDGPAEDPHPADLARAYLAAEAVRLLSFRGAGAWADRLEAEADRDAGTIRLGGVAVTRGVARQAAAAVARAIVQTHLTALEGRALGEIQGWSDADEAVVADLRRELRSVQAGTGPAASHVEGAYAAHAVAAGVYEAVGGASSPAEAMRGMIALLDEMHDRNPDWGSGSARAVA